MGGAYWTTLALRGVADEVADDVAEVVDEIVCLGRARCSWVCTGQLQPKKTGQLRNLRVRGGEGWRRR